MLQLDPIWQADQQQRQFRRMLDAMSHPGRCYASLGHGNEEEVVLAILATLVDAEVTLADPHHLLCQENWPMLQAGSTTPQTADFIVCDASQVPVFTPKLGSLACPEQSATLILMVNKLGTGETRLKLTGPGIENSNELAVDGLAGEWLTQRAQCNSAFPLGVDWILADAIQLAAIPRTTHVEIL